MFIYFSFNQVSYGEMVGCDNQDVSITFSYIGMKKGVDDWVFALLTVFPS